MRKLFIGLLFLNLFFFGYHSNFAGLTQPSDKGREPARINQQVNQNKITLYSPPPVTNATLITDHGAPTTVVDTTPQSDVVNETIVAATPTEANMPPAPPEEPKPAEAPKPVETKKPTEPPVAPPIETNVCVEWGSFSESELTKALSWVAKNFPKQQIETKRNVEKTDWVVMIPPFNNAAAAQKKAAEIKQLGINDAFVFPEGNQFRNGISLGIFSNETSAKRFVADVKAKQVDGAVVEKRQISKSWLILNSGNSKLSDRIKSNKKMFTEQALKSCKKQR